MNKYERIAGVMRRLDQQRGAQPSLATLASWAGMSPRHFHRLFSAWAGVTPKDFAQCLTLADAQAALREGRSVLDAAINAGLSGPGRLHDLCVQLEAASPGEIKSGGAGWTITAGFADSPFGACLVGQSPRGVCHLSFVNTTNRRTAAQSIAAGWPRAKIKWDDRAAAAAVAPMFRRTPGKTLRAFVRGTPFQVRVWRALLHAPRGSVVSYSALAAAAGNARAVRATATAVANNHLAWLIPCHRVIRQTGAIGNYGGGPDRKRAMLAWERAA